MAGTAMLIVLLLVCTFIMGLVWIVISPGIQQLVIFFNEWVLQGWVTDNSETIMNGCLLAWLAIPSIAFLGYIVGTTLRAQILKERGL
jgi:hypothetical protein